MKHPLSPSHRQTGISLIELMIALALGLVIVLAVTNIYLSNKATFRSQEALAQIQQSARVAFELLSHDIREAGISPCGIPPAQVKNGLNTPTAYWWANWATGNVQGFDSDMDTGPVTTGTTATKRASGTDAVILRGSQPVCNGQDLVISSHDNAKFTVATVPSCVAAGDVMLACDQKEGAIFQLTALDTPNKTLTHGTGVVAPSNASATITHKFEGGGLLSRLSSVFWYVGNNDHDGKSLFRVKTRYVTTPTAGVIDDIQEIAEGITNLQIAYLFRDGSVLRDSYEDAKSSTVWNNPAALPVAVRLTLTVVSTNKAGTDQKSLSREFVHVVSLRNREVVQ